MKLILIYGPPAVGKLTTAKILADQTGYKLFHNHLTFDALEPVFGALHPEFAPLLNRIRLTIVKSAAKVGFDGLIMTHVYAKEDLPYIRRLERVAKSSGGDIYFVRLTTDPKTLSQRVEHPSRHEHKKIRSAVELKQLMADWDVTGAIDHPTTLTIDNTNRQPHEVAGLIIDTFELPTVG